MRIYYFLAAALLIATPAVAQNSPSNVLRVQGALPGYGDPVQVTLRAPDGANPTLITGAATSTNQTSQITQETAINTALGTATASPAANTVGDRLKTINNTLTTQGNTRHLIAKGVIANGTGLYTQGSSIGGLVTISGFPAGAILNDCRLSLKSTTVTMAGALEMMFFDANPTTSTFTDNVSTAVSATDMPKLMNVANYSQSAVGVIGTPVQWTTGAPGTTVGCPRMAADGSGNFYLSVSPNATVQWGTASTVYWTFDALY